MSTTRIMPSRGHMSQPNNGVRHLKTDQSVDFANGAIIRFQVSFLRYPAANKSGGCECFPVAKERLFRASVSVGEQCHRMRSRACRNELKRRRIFGERHFLDADARLKPMCERQAAEEANDGDSGDQPVPTCAHSEKSLRTVPKSCEQLSWELCRVAKIRKGVTP